MEDVGDSPKDSRPSDVPDEATRSSRGSQSDHGMVETREEFIARALIDYESPLVGYAMGFVKDLDRARDVVQDTFIRLCRQDIDKVRDGLKSWLFTVCRNRALDVLRKESRMTTLDEENFGQLAGDAASPDDEAERSELLEQVLGYMDRLSDNQKTVILMKFRDGMSYQEISDATGLSGGNVGFLIHTGLKKLRQMLPPGLTGGRPL